jgi:hypothetical protein
MYFRFTLFNSLTLTLMGLTVWMAVARVLTRLDSNWPLVYYLLVLAYWKTFEGALNNNWVLIGIVCGMLLRFEFMGGIVLKLVRVVEFAFFAYVLWRSVGLILGW